MLKTLLNWLSSAFAPESYQSELEAYIASKNPQTQADVDHWLAEYDNERRLRARFIANEC